jgi:DNA mismatch repair protein MutS
MADSGKHSEQVDPVDPQSEGDVPSRAVDGSVSATAADLEGRADRSSAGQPGPTGKLTPMMQRYVEVKAENPEALLLFRMGDFYELFYDDARIASPVLGLTLTSRDKNSDNPVPMAGFPYHSLDGYLQKLIRAGYRVSICDQVEDPKTAKGMVRREVTQTVTPGTLTDPALLDASSYNYIAGVSSTRDGIGLSWLELSTGQFQAMTVTLTGLADELARLSPSECVVAEEAEAELGLAGLSEQLGISLSRRAAWQFGVEACRRTLLEHFGTLTLEGFGFSDEDSPAVTAAGAVLSYVSENHLSALPHISRLDAHSSHGFLMIDEATRRSLELTRTLIGGHREGSLLSVIDETVTSMGARLLGEWLSNPLRDIERIAARLDAVEEFRSLPAVCGEVSDQLGGVYDLERLTSRAATGRASPRDMGCLAGTLARLPALKRLLSERGAGLLRELHERLDLCEDVLEQISLTLVDEPPLLVSEGGMIRDGFDEELDRLRGLARGGKEWIAAYQASESERTGIANLKVGFNKVFGYYLEVTATQLGKVPEEYIRKQTLKNQERYVTPELKEHEEKVLRAEEQAVALEQQFFGAIRDRVAAECLRFQASAAVLARLDVLCGLGVLAASRGYCRPELTDEPVLDLRESRHPVLDRIQPTGEFVPNDVRVGGVSGHVQIITGPNMAGKSTYIRQAALLTILAQMGSFVPASEALVGVADRVFARVGASDELSKGQSTFMVEMTEAARILNGATSHSLVVLDEIGRGTSTYDGISLAWAITEHLHDRVGCRTLFATHYHELTELSGTLAGAVNLNVLVHEQDEDVVFLHKIVEGSADKSYGIHVARLAGVPGEVIERARVILETLESAHLGEDGRRRLPTRSTDPTSSRQLSLFEPPPHPLLEEIRGMDIEAMTPLAALEELDRIRRSLLDRQ